MRFVVRVLLVLALLVMLPGAGVYAATIEFTTISVSDGIHSLEISDDEDLGLPALSPGDNVDINGVGASYNGTYYVHTVTHSISGNGYRQRFKLKRKATASGVELRQTDEGLILTDYKFSFSSTVVDGTTKVRLEVAPIIQSQSADLRGKVIGIADGVTFTLLTADKIQVKVRLAEVDAPESGQPYGNKSKQALSTLIFGKDALVSVQTEDRYERTVGRPYVGNLDVCAEMIRMGAAWAHREYLRDEGLLTLEAEARVKKRGVWGLSEAQNQPPWEWRRSGGGNQSGDCQIKGDINSNSDRIYHVPGSRSYGATRINEAQGERWFCSEEEARAAGWRAPRH